MEKEDQKEKKRLLNIEARKEFEHMHKDEIERMLEEEISRLELPENSLYLNYDDSQEQKVDALYSIYIYEPEYPQIPKATRNLTMNTAVVAISATQTANKKMLLDLNIHDDQYEYLQRIDQGDRNWNIIKDDFAAPKGWVKVRIPLELSTNLIDLLKECVDYSVRNYISKATRFGCCSRFNECSDAKKCVHPNKLYACACYYKSNLDRGRIFYGVNRNVD